LSSEWIRYRGWTDPRLPGWFVCWPIARTGLLLVIRRKLFWLLFAIALLNFLFLFATIYIKAEIVSQNPDLRRFVDRILSSITGTGETYRDFMSAQGTVTMLLLAFGGATLVGDDMRQGGLAFYLSRRVHRGHYIVGKLLSIAILISSITTLPALILYLEYGCLADSAAYFRDNLSILRGIIGYGLVLSVTLSLLLFALASWVRKTVPLVMCWATLFVMLPTLASLLRRVYGSDYWLLLMLWRNLRLIGTWCFGAIDTERELLLIQPATWIVVAVCGISMLLVWPQVRAARVVQ